VSTKPQKIAYSMTEATEMAPVSRATLYRWAAEGRLPIKRIGNRSFIPAEAFHDLFESAGDYERGWCPKNRGGV
jgi:excisionase family DNA binding protein